MVVDLVVAVATVVLVVRELGGHWEEGRENERNRRELEAVKRASTCLWAGGETGESVGVSALRS